MSIYRVIYIFLYILYFITLALFLWFLIYYSDVPLWVWLFFGISILLSFIAFLLNEFALKHILDQSSNEIQSEFNAWSIFYIILQIVSTLLIIIGLFYIINYSTLPWFIWILFGIAIVLFLLSIILNALIPSFQLLIIPIYIFSFIIFIIALIFVIIYSNAPWWVWIFIIAAIFFSVLASIFQSISYPFNTVFNQKV